MFATSSKFMPDQSKMIQLTTDTITGLAALFG